MILGVVLLIFGISTLESCEKEYPNLDKAPTGSTLTAKSVSEQQEIFKEGGERHNEILAYVGKKCKPENTSAEDRFLIAREFTQSEMDWETMQKYHADVNKIVENEIKPSDYILSLNEDVNPKALALFDSLDAILDYSIEQIKNEKVVKPDEYKARVNELINYVYKNYEPYYDAENDSADIFAFFVADCYLSMASYEFWYNAANDDANPWFKYLDEGEKCNIFRRIWHGIKVAAADTWGFVSSGHVELYFIGIRVHWYLDESINHAGELSASV